MPDAKDLSMMELVDLAKQKGYNPAKDSVVTKDRDSILSQKAMLDRQLEEAKAEITSLKNAYNEAKKSAEAAQKELEAQKENEIKEKKAKIAEIEKQWKEQSPETIRAIPDFEDVDKKYNWLSEFAPKFMGQEDSEQSDNNERFENKSETKKPAPATGEPVDNNEYSEKVKNYAAKTGISPQAAHNILKRRKEAIKHGVK